MTTIVRAPAARTAMDRPPMDPARRTAFLVGALFLTTYLASIPPKIALYTPFTAHADYIVGAGDDTRLLWGAFLEMILIIANIGSAVALFRVVRRRHENLALAFVTARVMESAFIAVGILSVLSLVTLRHDFGGATGADATALATVGDALVALHGWTFSLGPGFVVGVGNGMILGYLMFRTGLVPRGLAVLGMIAGPLLVASGTAVLFGVIEPDSAPLLIASVPEFFWELLFGLYLVFKGFKPAPILTEADQPGSRA